MSVQEFVVNECHVCAYETRCLVSTVISTILEEFSLSLPPSSSSLPPPPPPPEWWWWWWW